MARTRKATIIETPEIVRPRRTAKDRFNERLGLHGAGVPDRGSRTVNIPIRNGRKTRTVSRRRAAGPDVPKLLNPKLDDDNDLYFSEEDRMLEENSALEYSKETSGELEIKDRFNERLGLYDAGVPDHELKRAFIPIRVGRKIRNVSYRRLAVSNDPKLDNNDLFYSEEDMMLEENSTLEYSKETSGEAETMEVEEDEQRLTEQSVESFEEDQAASEDKILVYMDHDLTPVAPNLVHLNDFKEMSDYKSYISSKNICDVCCSSSSEYQDYVKHVNGHSEIHAICGLCPYPATPYSLNAFSQHIPTHFRKENDVHFCNFCDEKFSKSVPLSRLVQHLYFYCDKIPKCLICAQDIPIDQTPSEHRRKEHARILDRFLCTACFRGFATHEKRLKHQCELTLRCVCDLCVTFSSVDELIKHLKVVENPSDHGFLVPHQTSHRELYIDNPHSVCSTNYEEIIRQTHYPGDYQAQKQAKRGGITTSTAGGCRTRRARISPSEIKERIDSKTLVEEKVRPARSLVDARTLIRSTSLEFERTPSPQPASQANIESKATFSPSSSIENDKPTSSTFVYNPKVMHENQVLIKNGLTPYIRMPSEMKMHSKYSRNPKIVLPRNPVFRLQVQGQGPSQQQSNIGKTTLRYNGSRMITTDQRSQQSPFYRPGLYGQRYPPPVTTPETGYELRKQSTEEINNVMRKQYLKSREQYEFFQHGRGIPHDSTETYRCFCNEEGFTLYHYLEHIEQAHYSQKRLNSPIVPKNATLSICRKCKLTFESVLQFGIHMKRHHAVRHYPKNCPDCSSVVMDEKDLDAHERIEKTKWICARCNQKFATEINFFGHVAKKLDHGSIFYFCTSCCIGNSEPHDVFRHVMTNRCNAYARMGYILMDTLQHRPIFLEKYNEILRPINLMPPQNSCNHMVDLEVHPGDVLLKPCCNRLHRLNKAVDAQSLYSSNWNATIVTPDVFLKIHQRTPFVAEWHLTVRGYPDLLPDLDNQIKPQRPTIGIPRPGIIRMIPRQETIPHQKISPNKELLRLITSTGQQIESSPPADPKPEHDPPIIQIDDEEEEI